MANSSSSALVQRLCCQRISVEEKRSLWESNVIKDCLVEEVKTSLNTGTSASPYLRSICNILTNDSEMTSNLWNLLMDEDLLETLYCPYPFEVSVIILNMISCESSIIEKLPISLSCQIVDSFFFSGNEEVVFLSMNILKQCLVVGQFVESLILLDNKRCRQIIDFIFLSMEDDSDFQISSSAGSVLISKILIPSMDVIMKAFQRERDEYIHAELVSLVSSILRIFAFGIQRVDTLAKEAFVSSGLAVAAVGILKMAQLTQRPSNTHKDEPSAFFGFKVDIMKTIANLSYRSEYIQQELVDLGVIPLLLSNTNVDDDNPFIREWSVFALRNLCDGKEEYRDIVKEFTEKFQQFTKTGLPRA